MEDDSCNQFLPSAPLKNLRLRAKLLQTVREFFHVHDYWEVQTPLLSRDVLIDAHIEPFSVIDHQNREWFLQSSPEFGMKRILAAGAEAIFQIAPAFRQEEFGPIHNLEFTMLEWYRAGETHIEQMNFTEKLVRYIFQNASQLPENPNSKFLSGFQQSFDRLRYNEAFQTYLGKSVIAESPQALKQIALEKGLNPPESLAETDRDGWLNFLLAECVEPHLGVQRPVFLHDYPASQAALAKIRDDSPPVAERFELYINGMELCNGYHELTNGQEFQRRNREQQVIRQQEKRRPLPENSYLLEAMQSGIPDCSGVALGFDRLVMLAIGATSLAEVLPFPSDRA
ncbi:MAG: elongation factor P--(R)-beta-lysine ligase [Planctomycetaceae bacterium]